MISFAQLKWIFIAGQIKIPNHWTWHQNICKAIFASKQKPEAILWKLLNLSLIPSTTDRFFIWLIFVFPGFWTHHDYVRSKINSMKEIPQMIESLRYPIVAKNYNIDKLDWIFWNFDIEVKWFWYKFDVPFQKDI